jgi:hypothetical protein
MPVNRSHIIQKQTFELSASGAGINLNWEQRASDCVRNILNPCIEECFNEASAAGHHLIIDKLDLDLGSFTNAEFEKKVAQKLREVLSTHLHSCITSSETNNTTGNAQQSDNDETAYTNADSYTTEKKNEIKFVSNSKAFQLALAHFLAEGRFPWWYSIESNSILVDEIFETGWMESMTESDKDALKNILQSSEQARIRLANHFTAEWIAEFLRYIGLRGNDGLFQWQLIARLAITWPALKSLLHQHFWLQWIMAVMQEKDFTDIKSIIERSAGGNGSLIVQLAKSLQNICKEESSSNHFPSAYINYVEQEVEKMLSTKYDAQIVSNEKTASHSLHKIDADKQTIEQLLNELSSDNKKKKAKRKDDEEGLIIAAAGMVILHPFLEELFSSNGLLNKNTWTSDAAWCRAVRYLAYLSYGNENAAEYDLVFHKTLVGMDVETALPADLPLTDAETASCNELLQAVISHWKALRNTSPDGLREGFLQREGKLSQADKGLVVHVAQKPQDILLAHLPWGCGMIKLPWLENIIHVTWI